MKVGRVEFCPDRTIDIYSWREATPMEAQEWLAELISCFAIERVKGPDPMGLVPTFDPEVLRQRALKKGVR